MFAAARLVDEATSNDDRPIPDSLLQEALNLCSRDPSSISKLVRASVSKLTNSFVMVRIKALGLLLHLGQNGPPSVLSEIASNSIPISAVREWRGDPHPVRGYEPYDAMREGVDLLLTLTRPPGPKSRFAKQHHNPPARPPPDPSRSTTSIMTPYPDNSPSGPPRNSSGFSTPYSDYPTSPYSEYSSPANTSSYAARVTGPRQQTRAEAVGASISGAASTVAKFFKKPFQKRGEFSSFPDQRQPEANLSESSYSFTPVATEAVAQPGNYSRGLTQSNLLEENAPVHRSVNRIREGPLKPQRKAPVNLTAAKRLLKVTGGRALANADELGAFQEAFSAESIDELAVGLSDQDWKVRVRAILGLELAGERYGLQAVAKVKQEVLSLNGAPQASLRTAAVRFYSAIKDVKPGPPAERSAFSFISEELAEDDDTGGFSFVDAEEGQVEQPVEEGKVEPPVEEGHVEEEEEGGDVEPQPEKEAAPEEPPVEPTGDEAPTVTEPTDEKAQDDE